MGIFDAIRSRGRNAIRRLGRNAKGFFGVAGSLPMARPAEDMAQGTQPSGYMKGLRLRNQTERSHAWKVNEAKNAHKRAEERLTDAADKLSTMLSRNFTHAPQGNMNIRQRDSNLDSRTENLILDGRYLMKKKTFRPDTREGREFMGVLNELNTARKLEQGLRQQLNLRQSMKRR